MTPQRPREYGRLLVTPSPYSIGFARFNVWWQVTSESITIHELSAIRKRILRTTTFPLSQIIAHEYSAGATHEIVITQEGGWKYKILVVDQTDFIPFKQFHDGLVKAILDSKSVHLF